MTGRQGPDKPPERGARPRRFYRIIPAWGGLCNVWLTPGTAMPVYDSLTGRTDYGFRILAVCGVDPNDPKWGGDLEGHIRRNYEKWLESAEEIEV